MRRWCAPALSVAVHGAIVLVAVLASSRRREPPAEPVAAVSRAGLLIDLHFISLGEPAPESLPPLATSDRSHPGTISGLAPQDGGRAGDGSGGSGSGAPDAGRVTITFVLPR